MTLIEVFCKNRIKELNYTDEITSHNSFEIGQAFAYQQVLLYISNQKRPKPNVDDFENPRAGRSTISNTYKEGE